MKKVKTSQKVLYSANNSKLKIKYKLQNVHICQNTYYFRT